MGFLEGNSRTRRVIEESCLPAAPMSMPEQTLVQPGSRGVFFRPLIQWLALR